ncbi:MAG: O-antigen ligase family protein [Candidatus Omnitrophica bacterium]|nr:O-antigen ligase family protein [Candidatus Omnitrophota bacterium]
MTRSYSARILNAFVLFLFAACFLLRLFVWKLFPTAEAFLKEDIANLLVSALVFFCAAVAFLRKYCSRERVEATGFEWPLGVLVLAAAFSILYSVDTSIAIKATLALAAHVLLFYVAADIMGEERRIRIAFLIALAAALLTAFFGIREYYYLLHRVPAPGEESLGRLNISLEYILLSKRVTSFLGWPNSLAGYLMLLFPATGLMIIGFKNIWARIPLALATLTLLLCYLFTFSFLGWTSLFLATLCLTPWLADVFSFKRLSTAGKVFLTAGVVIFIGCFLVVISKKSFLSSLVPRVFYHKNVLKLILDQPFFGYGMNTFRVSSAKLIFTSNAYSAFVHNSYLQVWVEAGLVGFAALLAFVWKFVQCTRRTWAMTMLFNERLIFLGLTWGLAAFLIDNLYSFTLLKPNIGLFFWAHLGAWVAYARMIYLKQKKQSRHDKPAPQMRWPLLAGMVIAGVLCFFTGRLTLAMWDAHQAMQITRLERMQQSLDLFNTAEELDPWDGKIPGYLGNRYIQIYRVTGKPKFLELAQAEFEEGVRRSPNVYDNYFLLSRVCRARGNGDCFTRADAMASRLFPFEYHNAVAEEARVAQAAAVKKP